MGMFDTVHARCPIDHTPLEFQSKSGECMLRDYSANAVPVDVAPDAMTREVKYPACEKVYMLHPAPPWSGTVPLVPIAQDATPRFD